MTRAYSENVGGRSEAEEGDGENAKREEDGETDGETNGEGNVIPVGQLDLLG